MPSTRLSVLWSLLLLPAAAMAAEPASEPAGPAEATEAAAPGDGAPRDPVPADDRLEVNREFRRAFDERRYADALPFAARVVELTASQYGTQALELVNPLTNLATTHYRLRQYEPALDTYRAALTLVEADTDSANTRLVPPLHGLGLSLRALDRGAEAIVPLKRAVDILRNQEGLFTTRQLPLLGPLADSYMDAQRTEEAGSTQQYALTVAETAWGRDDVRLLPTLDAYARWNETAGRFSVARLLHARAVQIADRRIEEGKALAIPGLRGMARTYRLAYLYGETEASMTDAASMSMTDSMLQRAVTSPSLEGERALRKALELLDTQAPGDALARGEVLTDLGDWYLTGGAPARALTAYREAWSSLQSAGQAARLASPEPVTYRPPSAAVSRGAEDPDRFEQQDIEFMVSVDANGEVREATAVNSVAERESVERSVAAALRRSRFRPAIIDGEAVAKTDVAFTERVNVRIPKEATSAAAPAEPAAP